MFGTEFQLDDVCRRSRDGDAVDRTLGRMDNAVPLRMLKVVVLDDIGAFVNRPNGEKSAFAECDRGDVIALVKYALPVDGGPEQVFATLHEDTAVGIHSTADSDGDVLAIR